jgi:hypothetical protein
MKKMILVLLIPLASVAYSQDFSVDDFLVRWTIMGVGNTELRVMKTQDATFINIYRSNGITSAAARMSGDDAVQVAEALNRTREIYDSQEGTSDNVSESVTTGNFEVTFRTSVFNGFSVVIQEIDRFNEQYNDRYSTNAVTLPLEEAIGIQQDLAKAIEMIEFLDNQVSL